MNVLIPEPQSYSPLLVLLKVRHVNVTQGYIHIYFGLLLLYLKLKWIFRNWENKKPLRIAKMVGFCINP